MSRLGDQIREARLSAGIPPKVLARKCGVSESYLLEVESGRRIVNDDVANRFLKATGKSANTLMAEPEGDAPAANRPRAVKPAPAKPAEPAPPSDAWRNALSALVKQVPVLDRQGKQVGVFPMAVEDGKLLGHDPERVAFYLAPDDTMDKHRLLTGDKALVVQDTSMTPGKLLLVEIGGIRMARTLRERHSGKVVLMTDDGLGKTYPERDVRMIGRIVLVVSEV